MRLLSIATSAALLVPLLAAPHVQENLGTLDGDTCARVRIFCVRGTTELPGCGEIGKVVDAVLHEIDGGDYEAIDYPASGINLTTGVWNFFEYVASETVGVNQLKLAMETYHQRCPDTPTAVVGYSQGGQIVGDVLCGRSSKGFPKTDPIDSKYMEQVKAIIQLGDPTNRWNQDVPWHKGNDSRFTGGIFPRRKSGFDPCRQYGDRWQSWCDKDNLSRPDFFCGRGYSLAIHGQYVRNHGPEITAWIVSKLNAALGQVHNPTDFEL